MYAKLINGELIPAPNKIEKDGMLIVNPKGDLLKQLGYKEVVYPISDNTDLGYNETTIPMTPVYVEKEDFISVSYVETLPSDLVKISYEDRVVSLIREKYSVDDELAIIRQKDTKPEEFNTYFSFVEDCKAKVKE